MAFIWYLSDRPADAVVKARPFILESLHLVEFAILYGLFVLYFLADSRLTKKRSGISAVISGLYGLTDEIHQYFVPFRSATVLDWIKDITGVAILWLIIRKSYFGKKNRLGLWMESFASFFQKKNISV